MPLAVSGFGNSYPEALSKPASLPSASQHNINLGRDQNLTIKLKAGGLLVFVAME